MGPTTYRVLRRISKLLPQSSFYRLSHWYAKREYERFVSRRLHEYFVPVAEGAPAPQELLLTTRAMDQRELRQGTDAHRFFAGAYRTVHAWLQTVEQHSFNLRTCGAVLEIGCGSARLLRHFRCCDGMRVVGCDADPNAIEWCKKNIPGPEFYLNQLRPPLRFAQDESFDLILAASVFTHIPLDVQGDWICEMRRVLRPGGFFLCTVEGWYNQRRQLSDEQRCALRERKRFTLTPEDERASLSTRALGSWDVFQTRDEVIAAFGSRLRLLDYVPDKQDLLVLRKCDRRTAIT